MNILWELVIGILLGVIAFVALAAVHVFFLQDAPINKLEGIAYIGICIVIGLSCDKITHWIFG